jgi:hypothetical protein
MPSNCPKNGVQGPSPKTLHVSGSVCSVPYHASDLCLRDDLYDNNAAETQSSEAAHGSTAMEPGNSPSGLRSWPSAPAPATSVSLPQHQPASVANLSPQPQAFNHTDPRSIQDTMPDSGGLITQAPSPADETYYPLLGTLDLVGLSLDMMSNALTPGHTPMVPEGSYLDNRLAGSMGNSSLYLDDQLAGSIGNSSMDPGGLPHEPQTAASDHRAGSGATRSAALAPVRLFSKAAIYPYASQGLSCQGADSTVLSTAAYEGPTYCLGIRGVSKADAAEVRAFVR